jgi:hypothetical protein
MAKICTNAIYIKFDIMTHGFLQVRPPPRPRCLLLLHRHDRPCDCSAWPASGSPGSAGPARSCAGPRRKYIFKTKKMRFISNLSYQQFNFHKCNLHQIQWILAGHVRTSVRGVAQGSDYTGLYIHTLVHQIRFISNLI